MLKCITFQLTDKELKHAVEQFLLTQHAISKDMHVTSVALDGQATSNDSPIFEFMVEEQIPADGQSRRKGKKNE